MHVWFTMGDDGKGVLTGKPPLIARVIGTRRRGVYAQPGDWLLVRGLCAEGVKRMMGCLPEPGRPVPVDLSISPLEPDAVGQTARARPVSTAKFSDALRASGRTRQLD